MVWTLTNKLSSTSEALEWLQGTASTQYVKDTLVKMAAGLPVVLAGQTDQPYGLIQEMDPQPYNGQSEYNVNGLNASPLRPAADMLSTANGERFMIVPIAPGLELDTDMVPLLSRVAAVANAAKGSAVCAYGGATSDFNGGVVYLPDQDWRGVVITSVVAGGNVTLVFNPPAPRACTTGDVVSAIPFGVGASPKFDATNPQSTLSSAFADISGGNVLVRKVAGQYGSTKGSLFRITSQIKAPIQ